MSKTVDLQAILDKHVHDLNLQFSYYYGVCNMHVYEGNGEPKWASKGGMPCHAQMGYGGGSGYGHSPTYGIKEPVVIAQSIRNWKTHPCADFYNALFSKDDSPYPMFCDNVKFIPWQSTKDHKRGHIAGYNNIEQYRHHEDQEVIGVLIEVEPDQPMNVLMHVLNWCRVNNEHQRQIALWNRLVKDGVPKKDAFFIIMNWTESAGYFQLTMGSHYPTNGYSYPVVYKNLIEAKYNLPAGYLVKDGTYHMYNALFSDRQKYGEVGRFNSNNVYLADNKMFQYVKNHAGAPVQKEEDRGKFAAYRKAWVKAENTSTRSAYGDSYHVTKNYDQFLAAMRDFIKEQQT